MPNDVIVLDRSRHECYQTCPRKRYWEYEHDGIGLQRTAHSVPLLTGTAVHIGLAVLMAGGNVEGAVTNALADYDREVRERSIDEPYGPDIDTGVPVYKSMRIMGEENWLVKSNRALIEGLIRAYALVRLPKVLSEFEILEVEREEEATFEVGGRTVKFLARTDVLHRRRSDGQLYIRNFKTVSDASNTWQAAFRYDTQTISEVIAVEQRLAAQDVDWAKLSRESMDYDPKYKPRSERVHGVIIDGLIKQPRKCEYPRGSGVWHHCSPLIWGWQRPGNPPIDSDDWQSQYEWQDAFGANHRLGKGYSRKLVSEAYPGGVKAWIEQLYSHTQISHSVTLADQFIELPPILRADWQVKEWLDTTLALELNIAKRVEYLRDVNSDDAERTFNCTFPKFTANSNCFHQFGSQCPMFSLCWGGAADDPLANGYQHRIPNHPREAELVQLKVGA